MPRALSSESESASEAGLRAWRAVVTAHGFAMSRIEADLEVRGLVSLAWHDVLLTISSAPGARLRMGELATAIALSRSNATRLVDRLVAAGLVQRGPVPADGRGTAARLTGAGRRALGRASPVYAAGVRRYFAEALRRKDLELLAEMLERVRSGGEPAPRRRQSPPARGERLPGGR